MGFRAPIKEIGRVLQPFTVVPSGIDEQVCSGVVTDSREVKEGSLFVARKGESLDGHEFIEKAFLAGARACLVSDEWLNANCCIAKAQCKKVFPGRALIGVEDTTVALGKLASYWREQLKVPTIVLTGSNGKTSTKEMLRTILARLVGHGTANLKSFNNHVGLPQTILEADENSKWLLLEAGMNHSGELDYLGSVAKPDVAAVLNVGLAHLGFFSSVEEIADAKCELLAHVRTSGKVVLCKDDAELQRAFKRLCEAGFVSPAVVTFGFSDQADYYAADWENLGFGGSKFFVNHNGKRYASSIVHLGKHNICNAVAAVAISRAAFQDLDVADICATLSECRRAPMRLEVIEAAGVRVINDAYNANPVSMGKALEVAASMINGSSDRRNSFGVILGDMLELGERAESFHRELGKQAARLGAEKLVAFGNFAEVVVEAARGEGLDNSAVAKSQLEAAQLFLHNMPANIGVVLVKGSRGMALEKCVTKLVGELNAISSSVSAA